MAGIGFELKRISKGDSLQSIFRAYAYAGIISSGPWIISILSLVFLTKALTWILPKDAIELFSASVTHAYAFSLIIVGPIQLVLTRHAADKFFAKSRDSIFPSCFGALTLTAFLGALVGGLFFVRMVPGSLLYQISATSLMVCVSCIFIVSNYITALQNYQSVVRSFGLGYLASCALAWLACKVLGPDSTILGFAAGHAILLGLLLQCLHHEFGAGGPSKTSGPWDFVGYLFRFPALVFCGLFYNLGIWADKLMFWWFSASHTQISGALYAAPTYDTAIYLSLLSIVPGMAVFFLKLETSFAESYAEFFDAIQNRGSLAEIRQAKTRVVATLREGLGQLFKVQGFVTAVLVALAPNIAQWVGIGSLSTGIFRVTLFGGFLLVCFQSMLTVLFYFDDRRGALLAAGVFASANILLGILTVRDEAWFGFGFVVAAALGMLIVSHRLNSRVARLEELTFRS